MATTKSGIRLPESIREATVEFLLSWHEHIAREPSLLGKARSRHATFTATKPPMAGLTITYTWTPDGDDAIMMLGCDDGHLVRDRLYRQGGCDEPHFDDLLDAWLRLLRYH